MSDQNGNGPETFRHTVTQEINSNPRSRETLEAAYGQVWDTRQLASDFDVVGFMAPLVTVVRKSDRATGSLFFQHHPRFYWSFQPA